jgi:cysteinyl-tRNA synthetase
VAIPVLQVYDTRTGRERPLETVEPGHVRIYVCGITPYDHPHVGHARPTVVWDVIRRHLERRGYLVTLVQNLTDVDDRLIDRAQASGQDVAVLASQFADEYWRLMQRLRVKAPDYMPKATANVPTIIDVIERLVAGGLAYPAGGDVYYRVRSFPAYGALSHRDPDDMRVGARIEPNPDKEDPLDFALWKGARPGEPCWESPWGAGRPGWHVECSAMVWRYLGPVIDLHGGATDLIFPHHENEIAQSEPALGVAPHVRYWVHNGLVNTGGVKMSKSLGNGEDLEALIEEFGAETVRGYLLSVHYRTPMEFSRQGLEEFQRALGRVWRLWDEVRDALPAEVPLEGASGDAVAEFPERFLSALDQDFNTARAWAEVFEMVRAGNALIQHGGETGRAARGLVRRNLEAADEVMGFLPWRGTAVPVPPPGVLTLMEEREAARKARDWARADDLRDQIGEYGWQVEDTREGPVLRPRAKEDRA